MTASLAGHQDIFSRWDNLIAQVTPLLNQAATGFSETLGTALDIAASFATQTERRADLGADIARRRLQVETCKAEYLSAKTAWENAVHLHLGHDIAADMLRHDLQPLRRLRELDIRRAQTRRSVDTMRADQDRFGLAVSQLAQRHDISDPDPRSAFAALQHLAKETDQATQARTRLTQEQARRRDALDRACASLDDIARKQAVFAALFPPDAPTG